MVRVWPERASVERAENAAAFGSKVSRPAPTPLDLACHQSWLLSGQEKPRSPISKIFGMYLLTRVKFVCRSGSGSLHLGPTPARGLLSPTQGSWRGRASRGDKFHLLRPNPQTTTEAGRQAGSSIRSPMCSLLPATFFLFVFGVLTLTCRRERTWPSLHRHPYEQIPRVLVH